MRFHKYLMQRDFFKCVHAQNLQNPVEAALQLQLLFEDSDQYIDADRNPYLGFYRVVAGPVKVFDSQMLLT